VLEEDDEDSEDNNSEPEKAEILNAKHKNQNTLAFAWVDSSSYL